jgi:signal transduction histidine kinase
MPAAARARPDAPRLLHASWAGWAACVALFLAAWGWATAGGALYHLKSREAAIAPRARELAAAFATLQRTHDQTAWALAYTFTRGELRPNDVGRYLLLADQQLAVHWVDRAGRSRLPGVAAPAALVALARARVPADGSLTTIRPEPPGWRAGLDHTLGARPAPSVPEGLLAAGVGRPDGDLLIVETRLDRVFGPWLAARRAELGLPPDVVVRRLGAAEVRRLGPALAAPAALPDAPGPSAVPAIAAARSWRFPVATFFPGDPVPFDVVAFEVDNRSGLAAVLGRHLLGLLAGLAVLGAFAAALALAGRAVRRELALAQARADFTAMVSHELRTPVAAIAMYAEILEHRLIDDPAKIAAYHAIIGTEAARLRRLVDDLLDLGRIERGARTFALTTQDLGALAAEGARLGAEAHDRASPPAVEVAVAGGPVLVAADRQASVQAVANLVHNALKYGGDQAAVRVEAGRDAAGPFVDVLDRGPGVPAARRGEVFDPYVRLEREDTRTRPGTGLGLALVKGYAEGQGGAVEVGDRPGGGARFRLRWRAAGGDVAAAPVAEAPAAEGATG